MALKKGAIDNFFNISQKYATAKQKSSPILLDDEESTDITQTPHKYNTNITQNEVKLHTNITQTSHTLNPISTQTQHKFSTETNTNLTQTLHNANISIRQDFSFPTLVGNFKKIVLYIYNLCKFNGSYEVIISINNVAVSTQIPIGSVNTTLVRLEKMEYIQKTQSRAGRGGWKKIKINEKIYKEILLLETMHKPYTEPYTEHDTTSLSSGSNIYKTTTGDNLIKIQQLSAEWQRIEIEPLRSIGFTETHLSQIAKQNILSPNVVQDSINAFAFDLEENDKKKEITGSPINFFMGILRKGLPYTPPDGYETPQERHMRLYEEKMSKLKAQREEIEKKAFNLAFEDWFRDLPDSKKIEFIPENLRNNPRLEKSKMLEGGARDYFTKEIWPNFKKEITSGGGT